MKRILLILAFFPIGVYGQYSEFLQSDRPGQSITPLTLGEDVIQIQAGTSIERSEIIYLGNDFQENDEVKLRQLNSSILVRIGVLDFLETSIYVNHSSYENDFFGSESSGSEITLAGLGVRGNVYSGDGIISALGVELRLGAERIANGFNELTMGSTIAIQSELSEKFTLTANIISTDLHELGFTANLAYAPTNRLGIFAEYFPNFYIDSGREEQIAARPSFLNGGVSYYISKNFLVDLAGSYLIGESDPVFGNAEQDFFALQFGLTARLDWRD